MPNPFTEPETRYIFEILDCVYSTQYSTLDPMGFLGSTTDISNGSQGQAQTMVIAWLTGMDATSVSIVKTQIIPQWMPVRFPTAKMVEGSVGANSVTNVDFSFEETRQRIRDVMQVYIPFFRVHEVLAKRSKGAGNGLSIPCLW